MNQFTKTLIRSIAGLLFTAPFLLAQLTPAQRDQDFRSMAAQYAKSYAPYEWKRQFVDFDLYNIKPWLARVAAVKNDLDFYEIMVEYVASLRDTHDAFSLPSDFVASLGFGVDIYDGKVLIESINRTTLPIAKYPFVIADELVSVDDRPVEELLTAFAKYGTQGNPRSTRRITAGRIVTRSQSRNPHAVDVGESAQVVIRRQNGNLETYTIPWNKTGTPLVAGPVPAPSISAAKASKKPAIAGLPGEPEDALLAEFERVNQEIQWGGVDNDTGLLNYGSRTPIFALPTGFQQRLGRVSSDFFYSGTYQAQGRTIGYIRIPNYAPPSIALATTQLQTELAYFQANTDALIVDQMRNTGGSLCFGETVATNLIPYRFQATAFLIRPFWARVSVFYNQWQNAKTLGMEQWVIDTYQILYQQVGSAYRENRGLSGATSLCASTIEREPARDRNGAIIAYTKPILMVIDEFSTSTADSVPAMFQEAKRGTLFGYRTNGAGGNNTTYEAGKYGEGLSGMTLALQVRATPVSVPGYPTTNIIENVGVHPEIVEDYMTKENLLTQGKPFVDAMTAAVLKLIPAAPK